MTTAQQLLADLTADDISLAAKVRLEAKQMAGDDPKWASSSVKAYLETVMELPRRTVHKPYEHPDHAGRSIASTLAGGKTPQASQPLSVADVAWLQRLPTDPAQVTREDAEQLASLAVQYPARSSPDGRLVQSMWAPVKAHHDQKKALSDFEAVSEPRAVLPPGAAKVLGELVLAETPGLLPQEANARAAQMLTERLASRDARDAEQRELLRAQLPTNSPVRTPEDTTATNEPPTLGERVKARLAQQQAEAQARPPAPAAPPPGAPPSRSDDGDSSGLSPFRQYS